MSYKLEQSIVPPPGTDTTVACDFEISESSSKLPAFFPRKTKCTPADMGISMNGDVIQKTVDLHQKIDPHHDMGISMNSDVVKKTR